VCWQGGGGGGGGSVGVRAMWLTQSNGGASSYYANDADD
jgi:hypothetical protein